MGRDELIEPVGVFWVCSVLKLTGADEMEQTSRPLDTRKEAEKKYHM